MAKPLLLNCSSPLEECHPKVPESDTDTVHCPTCTFLMLFCKVNVCGASWACPSAFCQKSYCRWPRKYRSESWGWIIYTTATHPCAPFSLLIFCSSSSDAGLMAPSGEQNLAVRTPWKPPQRDMFLSICHTWLEQGNFSLCCGRKSTWVSYSKFINSYSDGIHLFLIYFSFVNLTIFLFECVSLWAELGTGDLPV